MTHLSHEETVMGSLCRLVEHACFVSENRHRKKCEHKSCSNDKHGRRFGQRGQTSHRFSFLGQSGFLFHRSSPPHARHRTCYSGADHGTRTGGHNRPHRVASVVAPVLLKYDKCSSRVRLFSVPEALPARGRFFRLRQGVSVMKKRNHQGVGNRLLFPRTEMPQTRGDIKCNDRLAGVLKFYYRAAA